MSFHSAESTEIDNQQAAKIGPLLTSVAARLTVMDREGIDIQAVSTAPGQYYYWADAEIGRRTARLINDNIASIVAGNPERFVGLATVPMQAPELAVAELTRAVKELGLRGVEIAPNVAGAELSEPRFRPFFAKAEEKAAKLPAIMTIPMIVFILPSMFLVMVGPAVVQVIAAFK